MVITANGKFPGTKLKGKERYRKLYHYTSFETFVKIWLTKKLKFGVIENVNDLQEVAPHVSCETNTNQLHLMQAFCEEKAKYKQISLTMDYDSYIKGCMSTMMWGHYGNKRRGVCIELDYDKLSFHRNTLMGIVNYKKILNYSIQLPHDVNSIKDIQKLIIKKKKEIFFTKQLSWKGENEYRIISNEKDFLDIGNAITCIYLTSYNSDECLLIEKIVENKVPIKYLWFTSSGNKSIPITSETKINREQYEGARNDPKNYLVKLTEQAKEEYENMKINEKK
ncbi:MAG: DUF2971 domain-containing protein [Bacteroidales bacterium]|jgi:hypothetical protein